MAASTAAPAAAPNWADDVARERFLAIRRRMRELIANQSLPPDAVILYSGIPDAARPKVMEAFIAYLAGEGYPGGTYIDQTAAGSYLERQSKELLEQYLGSDWAKYVTFTGTSGEFKLSILGFWRELSARFAKKAQGAVHVLLPPDRIELAASGQMHWDARKKGDDVATNRQAIADLKTFGFVEFPILFGQISSNAGVTAIKLYEWSGNQPFRLVREVPPRRT